MHSFPFQLEPRAKSFQIVPKVQQYLRNTYKRTSPPKERNQHGSSGDGEGNSADIRSSTSRDSAEVQEKDYGALFRQPAAGTAPNFNGSSGWGLRRQSGSSDQGEDLSRREESSASLDRPIAANGEEDSKKLKETEEEGADVTEVPHRRTKGMSERLRV